MRRRTVAAGMMGVAISWFIAACGSTKIPSSTANKSTSAHVVYAGSLAYINDHVLGPGFQKSTGIHCAASIAANNWRQAPTRGLPLGPVHAKFSQSVAAIS